MVATLERTDSVRGGTRLLEPKWTEVLSIVPEIPGVSTYRLKFMEAVDRTAYQFEPGQFNMLYLPGYGEAAISISSDPTDRSGIAHTVRFVGNVTKAMSQVRAGQIVGLRGPFGRPWPIRQLEGKDLFIACGGIGLPPLRPVLYHVMRNRGKYGKVTLLYGARSPNELMYTEEYEAWRKADIAVEVTVDRGDKDWTGRVGVVPMWFYQFRIDPKTSAVLTCGPEIMIRYVIFEALARRVPLENIYVSLERNMKCGQGSCGHCQVGPYFVCKDGPVFPFTALRPYFNVEEF
jgi:NAD(P)H-flavin reductase